MPKEIVVARKVLRRRMMLKINQLIFGYFIFILSLLLYGCNENTANTKAALVINPDAEICIVPSDGGQPVVYTYDQIITESFVSIPPGEFVENTFSVTANIENITTYHKNKSIEILHTAEFSSLACDIHKSMKLPNNNNVCRLMAQGHYVVLNSLDSYTRLYNEQTKGIIEENKDPKFNKSFLFIKELGSPPCWEFPNEAEWSIIIPNDYFLAYDVSVVAHELMHVVAYATYGDPDINHKQTTLWSRYGTATIMSRMIQTYEIRHPILTCDNDDLDAGTIAETTDNDAGLN